MKIGEKLRNYWKILGPGLITGAADDDPSGIATYSQTGAQFGPQLIWLSLYTIPMAYVVQEMCARIGMATGRGLACNIRKRYPAWVLYVCTILLFAANTFNIAADIAAMATGIALIIPAAPVTVAIIVFALVSLVLQISLSYPLYARYLKFLALLLLSYVAAGFVVHMNWGELLWHTIVPQFSISKAQIVMICAILGTTISPYLFFWQTAEEVEEEIAKGRKTVRLRRGTTGSELLDMRIDVFTGMFVSELVMFFIIAVCASTLFANGITTIQTASDAAAALRPLAGEWAYALFAIGIIGTGLLSVPILAGSSAYAAAETFHWHEGLSKRMKQAEGFYGVIILSMIVAVLIDFAGIDPIKALIYSAIGNGIVAPILLFFIVHIGSDKKIMGKRANRDSTSVIAWGITGLMALAGIATIVSLFV